MRAVVAVIVGLWILAGTALADSNHLPFPRMWSPLGNSSAGDQLIVSSAPPDGALKLESIRDRARWPIVRLGITPWVALRGTRGVTFRPDMVMRLRRYNPNVTVIGYFNMSFYLLEPDFVPGATDSSFLRDYFDKRAALNGNPQSTWVYRASDGVTTTSLGFSISDNWANATFADTMAQVFVRIANIRDSTGRYVFDGFYFDSMMRRPGQSDDAGSGGPWDLTRLGATSDDNLDTLTTRNYTRMLNTIRAGAPPRFQLHTNPYNKADSVYFRAWGLESTTLEAFDCGSCASSQTSFVTARTWMMSSGAGVNLKLLMASPASGPQVYSATMMRQVRYTLGVSCLGDGAAGYFTENVSPNGNEIFIDEYSVDGLGNADTTGAHTGWLGQPLGDAFRTVEGVWRRDFQHGCVLVDSSVTAKVVDLGGTYQKINGLTSKTVNINNGQRVNVVTVPGLDATFLITPSDVCSGCDTTTTQPPPKPGKGKGRSHGARIRYPSNAMMMPGSIPR